MAYTPAQEKAHIFELQEMLRGISMQNPAIPAVIPDGVYTEATAQAVRAFQQFYGLQVTGEVNGATWEKIAAVYQEIAISPAPLPVYPDAPGWEVQEGQKCYTVRVAQAVLAALSEKYANLPCCAVTGILDGDTVRALQPFQRICGLPVTGRLDCRTWNMLAQMGGELKEDEAAGLRNR